MGNLLGSPVGGSSANQQRDTVQTLRDEANALAQKRNQAFEQSKRCYAAGDHKGAAKYSAQGKQYDARSKELHRRAADETFARVNAGRPPTEVDLHGLRVAEAVEAAERAIQRARQDGATRLVFITGKGKHSADGVAKLKPAVLGLADKHSLRCTPNVPNEGCVTVEFVKESDKGWFGDLVDGCTIC